MSLYGTAVRKPVSTALVFVAIVIFGLFSLSRLSVDLLPEIETNTIMVMTAYPGASASDIEMNVSKPLENVLNSVSDLKHITSQSRENISIVTLEFNYGIDIDVATNDVRDKLDMVESSLPDDVENPIIFKFGTDDIPILILSVTAEESTNALYKILDDKVSNPLARISGVGAVSISGTPIRELQVYCDPYKLEAYGQTIEGISTIIAQENRNTPGGSVDIGSNTYSLRVQGEFTDAKQMLDLVIGSQNGKNVYLRDVARVEDSIEERAQETFNNGTKGGMIVIQKQSGANSVNIAKKVHQKLPEIQASLPSDVKLDVIMDTSTNILNTIDSLKETIMITFIIVMLVVFVFLGRWRATFIIILTIPISLIASFAYLLASGNTLNIISLSSLSIAIGMVVDDAIVMTENIYIRIEKGMSPKEAGIEGAKEIFFAVISTTITLVAVFFPIVFMDGMTGRLFREFSIVISGSVIISSFAALTFTPMLATKLLIKREKQSWFYAKTEPFFEGMNRLYSRSLAAFLRKRWIALPFTVITICLIGILWNIVPAEMAPLEDRSQISINTRGAEGVTYEYIRDYTEDINQLVDSILPDAEAVTARVSSGSGNVRITLKDMQDRNYTQMEVAEKISKAVQKKTMARSFVQQQSSFGGRRGSMPVQYVLQATNLEKLEEVLPKFMTKVYENPVFQMADVDLKFSKPEARIQINRDKASIMGVSTKNIAQTLQYGLSGQRMGYFYMNGKQYEILGEINRQQRNKPADLKAIYIRSNNGDMIQLDNLIELEDGIAPPKLYRYNRFVSATISAGLADGKTIGQGLDEMDKIAKETLDDTFRTALSGDSKEYRESSSSLMFAFILAILLIYLILAAQFESFKDPLVIMLTVPLAIAGALVFMYFSGITMNIFSQIGIIMLIGLVAKNGILIVEFANQKQETGEDKMTAIKDAALQRLRPILMTSASTVLGLIPLAFATGEGCNQRIAMGTAVVGGMVVSTLLTMYIVPAIYSYISTNRIKKLKE